MEKRVVMCADGQSLRNPAMVGLAGEPLDAFGWLACASSAEDCRRAARLLAAVEEAWVVSCDDMEPINVAAAIKRDDPAKRVYVVSCGQNGSMASRVANAGIDGLWSESQFLKRFSQVKRACSDATPSSLNGSASAGPSANAASVAKADFPAKSVVTGRRSSDADALAKACIGAAMPQNPASMPTGSGLIAPQDGAAPTAKGAVSDASGVTAVPQSAGPSTAASPTLVLQSRQAMKAAASKSAAVIAVASGSGGCGKSTVAAIAAALVSKAGLSTIAIDADLQFGDLHYLLGVKEPLRIEEALAEPSRLDRLGEEAQRGIALIAAPRRLEMSEEVAPGLAGVIAKATSMCDVVIVNTGAFWSDAQPTTFEAADAVIFLMDSRPSSLRATTHAVELCARMGVATTSFTFAVNRHDRTKLLSAVDVSCSLRGAHAVELPEGGRDVDELLGSGYVQELLDSKNPLVGAVKDVLERVLPAEKRETLTNAKTEPARKRRSLFGRGG
ncbi:P-loop NTPase [uncultured Slackia sp.]|uniref:AAA family ATPase n=1 Tax=uncultured Slackia sp. TaxID=665903 RepID=UPI0026007FB9|nr:P-loop NTPase [uncultured Slackia sp.]